MLESSLPSLTLVSKGKVRDIYATSNPSTLLFVATDRISAYDVVLRNVSFQVRVMQVELAQKPSRGYQKKGVYSIGSRNFGLRSCGTWFLIM